MTPPRDEATLRQIAAADPRASTWLSANAGSGKTRVLTDRVARLLLDGTSPQNILCLTYTKAAASEMQNRLFRRLGAWAMAPEPDLRAKLADLGVEGDLDAGAISRARTLFARAVETPGGLKIQTIHSFCAALLRRFPLEAGVSPDFTELDERSAARLMSEIVEEIADGPEAGALADLARHVTMDDDLTSLTQELARTRDAFDPPLSPVDIARALGAPGDATEDSLLAEVFDGDERDCFDALLPALRAGSANDVKAAPKLAEIDCDDPRMADLERLEAVLLTGASAKEPFASKAGKFPTKATRTALGVHADTLDALADRVAEVRPRRLAFLAARKTAALHRFAGVFLPAYAARKQARGWLDFDDLILGARRLLTDPAVAAWVLYRLDGGIDHILIDEAQDTSPVQWQVIERLAQEIAAGHGREEAGRRTIFVVGDRKQSIYSFQGADPDAFDRMHGQFAAQLAATGLHRMELQHSFRSSDAILSSVDRVFASPDRALGPDVRHRAFHEAQPGRVDLWPLAEPIPAEDDPDWFDPVDRVSPVDAKVRLAEAIAGRIRQMRDGGETIPTREGRRPMHEGDVLILVRGRGRLFDEIISACKRADLAIAGADRLKLGQEIGVRDLIALMTFLATPEDDLSLAAALRSPLLGWSEGELYDLAQPRGGAFLWTALRNHAARPDTLEMLHDLRDNADYLRPFDLLDRILVRHGGRDRLLARLGPEAEDGIDELLSQALAYERADIPSLTGFLAWLAAEEIEVRRQSEAAGRRIRVMTVHGAKGLEAPIVILPDTMRALQEPRQQILRDADGRAFWRTRKAEAPEPLLDARAELMRKDAEESDRLLYVAMTRAESWLIVCGAGDPARMGGTWYAATAAGMGDEVSVPLETPFGEGRRVLHADWDAGLPDAPLPPAEPPRALPDWIDTPAAAPVDPLPILSPSELGGAKALPGESLPRDQAKARGTLLHHLLEHLPALPRADWATAAPQLLAARKAEMTELTEAMPGAGAAEMSTDMAEELAAEAAMVLDMPELAALRSDALAEVDIAAALTELHGRQVFGTIDLLIPGPDRVLAIDYKSNRSVPPGADAVPEGLLRQMGAYAAALRLTYPGRRIETALLWTRTGTLMSLPDALTSQALARAAADLPAP
ncbi:double-strand break repair helicase AddA [Mesobaculum littorinae]|uniref:DNA 3'-5' helicase n=1 Tax=Mesobaculum littorinae TaxID=2486419 RepID=A0A438AH13_9RHOB|nr:double-strand break repair helicase AddA [Mesobaculum littorinae]RVV97999.1 double-strand break repair helicase AddA [Mesobaculum littorinae]